MGLVLVIDDHDDTRQVMERFVRQWGHTTLGVASGEAALALLATEKPDLIIVDGMMPGINGAEFIRLVRAEPSTAMIPAILFSAVADPTFIENAKDKGANEIWTKGQIDYPRMRERVEHYINAAGDKPR